VNIIDVYCTAVQCLKLFEKAGGLPLTSYPFLLSPPAVYHPIPPELGVS